MLLGVGVVIGLAIGVALGGSFYKEHGRKVLPAAIISTLVFAAILGWALQTVGQNLYHTTY
jgi:uncharacterized membrane protein